MISIIRSLSDRGQTVNILRKPVLDMRSGIIIQTEFGEDFEYFIPSQNHVFVSILQRETSAF